MSIFKSGKRLYMDRYFDGERFVFYDSYKYKRDARREAARLKDRGYKYRILTVLAHGRGYNRHEIWIRRG